MNIVNASFFRHFVEPINAGTIDDPEGVGKYGDPGCGDYLVVYIKVEEEVITDIKFLCKGCPSAIATSSAMTGMVKGKTVREALRLTGRMVEDEVGGLTEEKRHCSNLGISALKEAIEDYRRGKRQP